VEIWNKRLTIYQGNYTKYLKQKDERRAQLVAAYRNQREQIEHLEAFINRFRAKATKAKQVQSRIKELEKIERIEIPEAEPVIHFRFPQPPPSGRMVVEADGLSKSYGSRQVLKQVRFTIARGDRVALVGVNGAGKSTIIRLLTGAEPPTSGSVRLGHNVVCEYFAQDQYKALDGDSRMIDDISRAALKVPEAALRSLLGCFLFSGDDVFKPLGVLSGGERNRYALARILVSPSNFLLLDEPTNHLDMRAKDVLLEALAIFSGTVIFVSHDRYFIDRLATRVLEVEGGTVTSHEGNYEDYLRWKTAQDAGAGANHSLTGGLSGSASRQGMNGYPLGGVQKSGPALYQGTTGYPLGAVPKDGKKEDGALAPGGQQTTDSRPRRLNPIRQKQMEERCAFLEEETPRIEAAIRHTEEQLGIFVSAAETQRLTALAEDLRNQLAALTAEWEELMRQLDGQAALS
jgi:ATP-binding cassette subfamily F protein 3